MAHASTDLDTGRWIEIKNPSDTDLDFLKGEFPFLHNLNLNDSLERVTHAKMDHTDEYLFLAVTVPTMLVQEGRLVNFEVTFFLTKDALISIVPGEMRFPGLAVDSSGGFGKNPEILLYTLLRALYKESNQVVKELISKVSAIDDHILTTQSPKIIREMAMLQINLTHFITTLEASAPLFVELEKKELGFGSESMRQYWSDIADVVTEQRDLLQDQESILTTLSRAHGVYMNHRTNHVITVLTVFSAIFLPLNLIASMYGMNLSFLPFAEHYASFAIVLGAMVVTAVLLISYFKFKDWA